MNKPKSVRHYTSGYNTINNILKGNGLKLLETWSAQNYENNYERTISIDEFKKLNSTGNNILTATLSNFKKFINYNMENIVKPIVPFDKFGWRWATTGISSKLNLPVSLFAVLDAILINGNGEFNKTIEFKNIIKKLCDNKYEINDQDLIKTLTREENQDVGKNIIENSGNYWRHIGLIDPSGQNATVTELGKSFLKGIVSKDEFIKEIIENYTLPSPVYDTNERQLFLNNSITIYPFRIILEVFESFYQQNINPELIYLSEADLKKIVVPYSIEYDRIGASNLVSLILQFRDNPVLFEQWPNCYNHYGDDKGERMINEYLFFLEAFEFLTSNTGIETVRKVDKKYYATNKLKKLFNLGISNINYDNVKITSPSIVEFSIELFIESCKKTGLIFSPELIYRFTASLLTKPFVICSGLSGSGKTKLAQAFVQWITESENQYKIIPVGADWTNREPLLGYPNGLEPNSYVMPDSGALQLILDASYHRSKPYFIILDEMNLSHVERYFADFLSIMESGEKLKLYSGEKRYSKYIVGTEPDEKDYIPQEIEWPNNLFIIGTVNIDETTYMFSPKVLDRANVIEFRITPNEMKNFFAQREELKMKSLFIDENKDNGGIGKVMGASFLEEAQKKASSKITANEGVNIILNNFFSELQKVGAEFGYRSATEIELLITKLGNEGFVGNEGQPLKDDTKIDIAIMQKLLPKLHGSRKKLVPPLEILAGFCLERKKGSPELAEQVKTKSSYEQFIFEKRNSTIWEIKYSISFEKIERMLKNVIENGFTSYAEA
jgi:hypothetical protein